MRLVFIFTIILGFCCLNLLATSALEAEQILKQEIVREGFDRKYYESTVSPLYGKLPLLIKKDKRSSLLKTFLDFVCKSEGNADEDIALTIAKIYSLNADEFEIELKKLPLEKRKIVYRGLSWGWENLLYGKKKTSNEIQLEKRIKKLEVH